MLESASACPATWGTCAGAQLARHGGKGAYLGVGLLSLPL